MDNCFSSENINGAKGIVLLVREADMFHVELNELTCFRDGFMDTSWLTFPGGLRCLVVRFTLFGTSNYFAKE